MNIRKPVVFFSHSTRDKEYVNLVRNQILDKSSSSIEIFSSSDGQSIDFGSNWLSSIEDALDQATTGFVFVSPNSLESDWIFFEAGFLYGRKMKIVPLGIMGIDLGKLRPPLSILQGFNITNADGLNNLLEVLNRQYELTIKKNFDDSDYSKLKELDSFGDQNKLQFIDHIYILVDRDNDIDISVLQNEMLSRISDTLDAHAVKDGIDLVGAQVRIKQNDYPPHKKIEFKISPVTIFATWPSIAAMLSYLPTQEPQVKIIAFFTRDFNLLIDSFQVSSRLHGFTRLSSDGFLDYRGLRFKNEISYNFTGSGIRHNGFKINMLVEKDIDFPSILSELTMLFEKFGIIRFKEIFSE